MSVFNQIILRNWARAEDFNPFTRYPQDGGFQSVGAGTSIKDDRDDISYFRLDILSRNRTDPTEAVCTRCGERGPNQSDNLLKEWMGGHAHGNALRTGYDQIGYLGMLGEDHRQRPRPEGRAKFFHHPPLFFRFKSDNSLQPTRLGKVDDQGIGQWTALGLKDPGHSQWLKGIGSQPVDRLGGNSGHPASAEEFCAFGNPLLPCQNARTHDDLGLR